VSLRREVEIIPLPFCLLLPAYLVLPAQGQLLFLSKEQETTYMQKLLLTRKK
jgi:hypothetical protein